VLDRRFHRTGFWQLLVEREITWVNAVPATLSILALGDVLAVPPELRFIRSTSVPLPAAAREQVTARSGVTVVESYGMTEAASQITATPLRGGHPPGSAGRRGWNSRWSGQTAGVVPRTWWAGSVSAARA
jgi:acyl-CoA synthetase (AMP-forming)/AMP-acid ligase II